MKKRSEQEIVRFNKLKTLREQGFAFPNSFKIDATSQEVLEAQVGPDGHGDRVVKLAGRLTQLRLMGKAAFCHLLDGAGKIQIYVRQDIIGADDFAKFKEFDIGDIVGVSGEVFVTKTGEKSLFVRHLELLTKCLIPLPEKWHGLTDVEARYRQRYVDLIANPEVRNVFRVRSQILKAIRKFFDERGFIEVETPILQDQVGGALAKPFLTHHNSLHKDMVLRIAPELPLKKLVVGGLLKVYELGRVFRNEGLSKKHNPEFTALEFYEAFATFEDSMSLTEDLLKGLTLELFGKESFEYGGKEINLAGSWPRLTMADSFYAYGDVSSGYDTNKLDDLLRLASERSLKLRDPKDWGKCLEDLWGELVEPNIVNPVFITHHPASISPLARRNSKDSRVTDRFELIICGMECANGFSELNDAEDQRERFEKQLLEKAAGNEEACDLDEDFLTALEYGLPPTAGQGIGIDRLVMLLTNSSTIRDVLLFPQMKSREVEEGTPE